MTNEHGQNGRREYRSDEITYAKGDYYKDVHMRTNEEKGVEKSVIR